MGIECCEITSHIFFLILTKGYNFSIDNNYISYSLSCLILNIYALLYAFYIICLLIFFCTFYIPSYYKSNIDNNINNLNISINETIDINKECCICYEKNTNIWINLKCNHEFHKICLNQWLIKNRTCPICRDLL